MFTVRNASLAIIGILLMISVTGCSNGPSDAERKLEVLKAKKQAVEQLRLKQKVKRLEKRKNALLSAAGSGSGGTQQVIPQSTSVSSGGLPSYRESCGNGVYADGSASCGFSTNIAATYRAGPASMLYDIYSPATGLYYDVSCSEGSFVTCTGGRAAVVYFYR